MRGLGISFEARFLQVSRASHGFLSPENDLRPPSDQAPAIPDKMNVGAGAGRSPEV